MNGSLKRTDYTAFEYQPKTEEPALVRGTLSGFSMAAVAGGLLLCAGIVIYALLTA